MWVIQRELDSRWHWWTPDPRCDDLYSEWTADWRNATAIPSRDDAITLASFYGAEVVQVQEVAV